MHDSIIVINMKTFVELGLHGLSHGFYTNIDKEVASTKLLHWRYDLPTGRCQRYHVLHSQGQSRRVLYNKYGRNTCGQFATKRLFWNGTSSE